MAAGLPICLAQRWEAAMFISRGFYVAVLVMSATGLSGCPGDGSRSAAAPYPKVSAVRAPGKPDDLLDRHERPATKRAPRETVLSSYSNPEEGISFRYPRYYALEEGDPEERSFFLKRQEDLDIERPGARLVATLLIPEDGYPNTTFEHGSLQVWVNHSATPQSCAEILWGSEQATTSLKSLGLQGVLFHGTEWQYLMAGTQVVERHYAGYSNGTCYEFSLMVAAEVATDPDGVTKPADESRIMRQLEKIVKSVRFEEPRPVPAEELNADEASRL
jgi:hypothetical protein